MPANFRSSLLLVAMLAVAPLTGTASPLLPPVIEYQLLPAQVAHLGEASVKIYATGQALITRPPYWTDAGTFEVFLTPQQLAEVLAQTAALPFQELAPAALSLVLDRRPESTPLFEVHDADLVRLTYRSGLLVRTVELLAPAAQADAMPEVEALARFSRLDRVLRKQLTRKGVQP